MSPLLSGKGRAAGALLTGTGIQRDLKLQLGFCNKKHGFYRFLKELHFCVRLFLRVKNSKYGPVETRSGLVRTLDGTNSGPQKSSKSSFAYLKCGPAARLHAEKGVTLIAKAEIKKSHPI